MTTLPVTGIFLDLDKNNHANSQILEHQTAIYFLLAKATLYFVYIS